MLNLFFLVPKNENRTKVSFFYPYKWILKIKFGLLWRPNEVGLDFIKNRIRI